MTIAAIVQKLRHDWHIESLTLRRALRCAIVVFISVLLYRELSITQGYWITLTAMIVVQSTVGATLRKGLQRFIGTLLGISIASLLLLLIHNKYIIDALFVLFLFATYFFNPFSNLVNYGFVVIPVSIGVVFMMALITPDKVTVNIVYARFYDTLIGAALGIIGSFVLLPNRVKREFTISKDNIRKQLAEYFVAIMNMLLNNSGATEQARSKRMLVEEALLADRQLYLERIYEVHFRREQRNRDKQFLLLTEKIAQQLFSLHHLARYPLAVDVLQSQRHNLQLLRNLGSLLLRDDLTQANSIMKLLSQIEQQIVDLAKNQDNPATSWRYLAPMANLNLMMHELIREMISLKSIL
jgi:uncharacterized membrane protein YgaE (UPF0421/DUF939 family)